MRWQSDIHVRSEGSQSKRKGHEERSGPVRPLVDEVQRVPQDLSVVENHSCAGDRDADETEKRERDRDDSKLNILASKSSHQYSAFDYFVVGDPHDLSSFAYR